MTRRSRPAGTAQTITFLNAESERATGADSGDVNMSTAASGQAPATWLAAGSTSATSPIA